MKSFPLLNVFLAKSDGQSVFYSNFGQKRMWLLYLISYYYLSNKIIKNELIVLVRDNKNDLDDHKSEVSFGRPPENSYRGASPSGRRPHTITGSPEAMKVRLAAMVLQPPTRV